jgi:hypothetical protein
VTNLEYELSVSNLVTMILNTFLFLIYGVLIVLDIMSFVALKSSHMIMRSDIATMQYDDTTIEATIDNAKSHTALLFVNALKGEIFEISNYLNDPSFKSGHCFINNDAISKIIFIILCFRNYFLF